MSRLKVAPSQDYLLRDGKPFFYLADTVWMAFANLSLGAWSRYLSHRKRQGFNALQLSILPITHDMSVGEETVKPFLKKADGDWDFAAYNEAYFQKAETMVDLAVREGFVPVLGVLWCSYVPGTRCSQKSPVASAMPYEAVEPYAKYVAERFKAYDPMFFISGDTHFEAEAEADYYMTALRAVRAVCPAALVTMHLHPQGALPRAFMDEVDFYMYQSGHGRQDAPYLLAETFTAYPVARPVVNSEPCYEGSGRFGDQSAERTRFNAFDVRKATYQSLLAGAKVGVAYGAHGVWSAHRPGMRFLNAHRSLEPFAWEAALELPGAWDVAFAKWLFETYDLFELEPASIVMNEDDEIRAATHADRTKLVVYWPYAAEVRLEFDLSGYRVLLIDLTSRRVVVPEVAAGATSRIRMPRFNGDALLLATL